MRTTNIMTISLPPAMEQQMKQVQKKENRTRSELLREAWRHYFESRYPVYVPTKAERAAIAKGRAEFARGEYVTLKELIDELGHHRNKISKKSARKTTG
jgi:predicted transcriptional regulator